MNAVEVIASALMATGHVGDAHHRSLAPIVPAEHQDAECLFREDALALATDLLASIEAAGGYVGTADDPDEHCRGCDGYDQL